MILPGGETLTHVRMSHHAMHSKNGVPLIRLAKLCAIMSMVIALFYIVLYVELGRNPLMHLLEVKPTSVDELNTILEEMKSAAFTYLHVVDNPPCRLSLLGPFMQKHELHTEIGKCYDSNWLHTTWDQQAQTFTMKCRDKYQIPMYHVSAEYVFDSPESNLPNWKLYPSQHVLEMMKSAGLPAPQVPISTADAPILNTACVDVKKGVSYHNYYLQQIRNESLVSERKQTLAQSMKDRQQERKPVDINVIVVDGAARQFFYRNLPRTTKYLEEMKRMENSGFTILDFENAHVMGYNSVPNMYAFTTGNTLTDNYATAADRANLIRKTHDTTAADYTPHIWDDLKKFGYITSAGEDTGVSGISDIYGAKQNHRSYDSHPLFHTVSHRVNVEQGFNFNYNSRVCPCAGHRMMSDIVYDWTRSHLNAYSDLPNFILAVNHEVHDAVGNQVVTLDPNLKSQLEWYVTSGRINNTVLVIMSDHGLHYGLPWMKEEQARLEHENPVLLVIAPDHLITDTLVQNTKRLVSLKDLSLTLKDFAAFPQRVSVSRSDVVSLLYDAVPKNRTCRDMQVPEAYATTCHKKGYETTKT